MQHACVPMHACMQANWQCFYAQARAPDGQEVAVKALWMRRANGWKALELFEREARVLQALGHAGIPRYIDYLTQDSPTDRGFFLVQARITGQIWLDACSRGMPDPKMPLGTCSCCAPWPGVRRCLVGSFAHARSEAARAWLGWDLSQH